MIKTITIEVKGLKEMRAGLRGASAKTVAELSKAVGQTMVVMTNQTIKEAPVNKAGGGGNLRQSVQGRMTSMLGAVVTVLASYGLYVHEGTRPHIIRPRNKKALSFEWGRGGFQAAQSGGKTVFVRPGLTANRRVKWHATTVFKEVHHPGTRANPFLQRAADKSATKIREYFDAALRAVADSITGK